MRDLIDEAQLLLAREQDAEQQPKVPETPIDVIRSIVPKLRKRYKIPKGETPPPPPPQDKDGKPANEKEPGQPPKAESVDPMAAARALLERKPKTPAFNKYNAPEVMRHLLALLSNAGLKDAVNKIRMKKIPELVDKAWRER